MTILRSPSLGLIALATAGALFVACGDDEPGATPAVDAGTTDDGAATDGTSASSDGGTDGSSANDPFVETSGARIKPEFLTAADGLRHRVGLYDKQLGFSCFVGKTSDGARRCMPSNAASAVYFTDSNCTTRVALYEACAPKPTYASSFESTDACTASTYHSYAVGADVSVTELFNLTGTQCTSAGVPTADYKVAATTPVPDTMFAAIEEKQVAITPDFGAVFDETADGLHALRSLRDTKHGNVECSVWNAADGTLRCLPEYGPAAAMTVFYSNATCTDRLAQWTCPSFALARNVAPGCDVGASIYRVGAARDADAGVFRKNDTSCTAAASGSSLTFKPVLEEVPASEFPAATLTPLASASRIRVQAHVIANATIETTTSKLFDTLKNTPCYVQTATDGKKRCLPQTSARVEAFADDQCTTPVAIVAKAACTTSAFAYRYVPLACDGNLATYPLLAKRASAAGYRDYGDGAGCVAEDYGASGNDLYDIGPEIPPTDFVEITTQPE